MFVYTDGSFSHSHSLGVAGFLIFKNSSDHDAGEPFVLSTQLIKEKNNIRLEILSAIFGLEAAENTLGNSILGSSGLHLFTDCQTIAGLQKRREKLENGNYQSLAKAKPLANTDLYKKFFEICDRLEPKIHWIKGHSPKNQKSVNQKIFEILDKRVRKELRERIA